MQLRIQDQLATSTKMRFRAFGFLIALLFSCSFAAVCVQLNNIAGEADRLDDSLIENTRLLGEMSDRVTELRLAQALLLLSIEGEDLRAAKSRAAEHRRVLHELELTLAASTAVHSLGNTSDAFKTIDAYLIAERDWENGPLARAGFAGATKLLYDTADHAVDGLIEANGNAAHAETARIGRTSKTLFLFVIGIGILVCAVKAWTMHRLEALVFCPLEKITEALRRLAAGHSETQLPVADRKDEIGGLIYAFQRFRMNAAALREAYVATKLAEETASRLARHDPLTGLFNRRHLSARINDLKADMSDRRHFLYVIDLDRFKPVNDLYGHAAGDTVLCTIADRLRAFVDEPDLVARPGGDEFAMLVSFDKHAAQQEAEALAIRVSEAIRLPFDIGHCQVEVGGSIGVAIFGRDGIDADFLVRSADAAMYRAKGRPGTQYQFFEETMREELRQEAALEIDVRGAVTSHTIRPHYQPLVHLASEQIYGFEVLARWTHPGRGNVTPDIFIPIIERLGLSTTFTLAMLRQGCRDALSWPGTPSLAINVSPQQLADALLPSQILSVLVEENFPAERLEIELTESALVGDIEAAKSTIENFRRWGIRVCLDDFGTGYSSLHHLRELQFDKIKIDKSFVQSMLVNVESEKIVDAILKLVSGLGLSTLAEGIETEELQDALRDRGCIYGQGYLFGKAVSSAEVQAMLRLAAKIPA